jgi:protocatechuate 3,4-dioxygenase alpha subunit
MIPTASQTVGPFFHFALTSDASQGRVACDGERIRLTIRILDGDGAPASGDAMVELWQADAHGRYNSASGFGRLETGVNGECVFDTVKPGSIGPGHAPHINVAIFGRGLLKQLHTRIYFAASEEDPVLQVVPEERRGTLLARESASGAWWIDIRLQGDGETVFFEL